VLKTFVSKNSSCKTFVLKICRIKTFRIKKILVKNNPPQNWHFRQKFNFIFSKKILQNFQFLDFHYFENILNFRRNLYEKQNIEFWKKG